MAAKQIDTIIGSYSVIPNSQTRPGTFSDDRDTYLAEEQDIIDQKNQVSIETNEVSTQINETSLQVAQNAQQVATDTASASLSASIAIGQANYKGDWVAGFETVGYGLNDSVSYTDGLNYVSKIYNNLTEPTAGVNTPEWNFIEAIDPNSVYTKTEADILFDDKADKTTTYNKTETDALLDDRVSKVTSTDNAIPKFNGTTGEIQDTGVLIDDNNFITTRIFNQDGAEFDGVAYADAGLLGVPDTSFSPTGARIYPDGVIRGKSSYGKYYKYPNGILECSDINQNNERVTASTAEGAIYFGSFLAVSFAHAFTVPPKCISFANYTERRAWIADFSAIGTSTASGAKVKGWDNQGKADLAFIAIGEWK